MTARIGLRAIATCGECGWCCDNGDEEMPPDEWLWVVSFRRC